MRVFTGFKDVLYSSNGLSLQGQRIATELIKIRSTIQLDLYKSLGAWRKGSPFLKLSDIPSAKSYRDLFQAIDALKPPTPGYFDRFVISTSDYARQGQLSSITKDGTITSIALEDAFNRTIAGIPNLTTGSANTFETSNTRATTFAKTLNIDTLSRMYLAMDPAWWPYNTGLIPLVERNILTDMVLTHTNGIVNTMAKINPDITRTIDYTHSYGNFSKAAALTTFEAVDIPEARIIMSAPLGIDLDIAALLEVKNRFLGKITVLRPGFDVLEEFLGVHQTLFLQDGIYDALPTDYRLATNKHNLGDIASAFKDVLQKSQISSVDFNEKYYSARPAKVAYFTEADGTITPEIRPRSGTIEDYLAEYNKAVEQGKGALNDILDGQASQLEEVLKYVSPTPDLESLATNIKSAKTSLSTATPETISQVLSDVSTSVTSIDTALSTQIVAATKSAQAASDSAWQERIQTLDTQIKGFNTTSEEARTKIASLEDGTYEPEV